MSNPDTTGAAGGARQSPEQGEDTQDQAQKIDIKELTERVYRLMLADLRIERERAGRQRQRTR